MTRQWHRSRTSSRQRVPFANGCTRTDAALGRRCPVVVAGVMPVRGGVSASRRGYSSRRDGISPATLTGWGQGERMPFTPSHIAAILPFVWSTLAPAALVVGGTRSAVLPAAWHPAGALALDPRDVRRRYANRDHRAGALGSPLPGPLIDFMPGWVRARLRPPGGRIRWPSLHLVVCLWCRCSWELRHISGGTPLHIRMAGLHCTSPSYASNSDRSRPITGPSTPATSVGSSSS